MPDSPAPRRRFTAPWVSEWQNEDISRSILAGPQHYAYVDTVIEGTADSRVVRLVLTQPEINRTVLILTAPVYKDGRPTTTWNIDLWMFHTPHDPHTVPLVAEIVRRTSKPVIRSLELTGPLSGLIRSVYSLALDHSMNVVYQELQDQAPGLTIRHVYHDGMDDSYLEGTWYGYDVLANINTSTNTAYCEFWEAAIDPHDGRACASPVWRSDDVELPHRRDPWSWVDQRSALDVLTRTLRTLKSVPPSPSCKGLHDTRSTPVAAPFRLGAQ
jgi:hypothetical protein